MPRSGRRAAWTLAAVLSTIALVVALMAVLDALMPDAGGDARNGGAPPPATQAPRAQEPAAQRPKAEPPEATPPRSERRPNHLRAAGPGQGTLSIPAIDVEAPVIQLGLNPDRSLQVPRSARETGYWSGGPLPGDRGAAVVAGHVDSRTGPGVFNRLGELRPGDEVRFGRSAGIARFIVERVERHAKDAFPTDAVYKQTARPTLRLITCSGRFDRASGHYEDNLVVFASQVRPAQQR